MGKEKKESLGVVIMEETNGEMQQLPILKKEDGTHKPKNIGSL